MAIRTRNGWIVPLVIHEATKLFVNGKTILKTAGKFYMLPRGIAAACDSLEDSKWGVAMAPRCFIKPLGSEASLLTLKVSCAFRGAQLETAHRDWQVAINERSNGALGHLATHANIFVVVHLTTGVIGVMRNSTAGP